MTKKKLSKKQKEKIEYDFLKRNIKAMKFCWENGLTIYASCQKNLTVKLFVQQGEKFRPLSEAIYGKDDYKTYNQFDEHEVMLYHIEMNKGYEFFYKKYKDG